MSYIGAFLTSESRTQLQDWWKAAVPHALHPTVYCDHMTIKFGPSHEDRAAVPSGACVTLEVLGYGADARGQAVVVQCRRISSANNIPHVTVAVDGAAPVYSNTLLAGGWTPVFDGPVLVAVVGGRNVSARVRARVIALDALLPVPSPPPNCSATAAGQTTAHVTYDRPQHSLVAAVVEKATRCPEPDDGTDALLARWAAKLRDAPPPDVVLVLPCDLEVPAHRYVLASFSDLFRHELYKDDAAGRPFAPPVPSGYTAAQAVKALAAIYEKAAPGAPIRKKADPEEMCTMWPFVSAWCLRSLGEELCTLTLSAVRDGSCQYHLLLSLHDVLRQHPSAAHKADEAELRRVIEDKLLMNRPRRWKASSHDDSFEDPVSLEHPAMASAIQRLVDSLVIQRTKEQLLELETKLASEMATESDEEEDAAAFAARCAKALAPLLAITRCGPAESKGVASKALLLAEELVDMLLGAPAESPLRPLLEAHDRLLVRLMLQHGSRDVLQRLFASPISFDAADYRSALLARSRAAHTPTSGTLHDGSGPSAEQMLYFSSPVAEAQWYAHDYDGY